MTTSPDPGKEGDMRDYAIILAADLPTADEVLSTVKKVGAIVDGVKVGVATLLEAGKSILGRIRDVIQDDPLLVDLKIADIGFMGHGAWQGTNSKIIKGLENSGATHVTVQGFPGPVSVAEAIGSATECGIRTLLLPLMSHEGAGLFLFPACRPFFCGARCLKSRTGSPYS